MEENPYKSPEHVDTSVEASLGEGEEILFQIAARSPSKRSWFFGLREEVIGSFIVTNRRVMFLSSGKGDGFGITYTSMVKRIARSVDFASMCKRSSWEFELSKVRSAEGWRSFGWAATWHLRLIGTDRFGIEVTHRVVPYAVKQSTVKEVLTQINRMRRFEEIRQCEN